MTPSNFPSRGEERELKPLHHHLPRWAWIAILGLVFNAILVSVLDLTIQYRRDLININIPQHEVRETADEIKDWEVYKDKELGFEIKLAPRFKAGKIKDVTMIYPQDLATPNHQVLYGRFILYLDPLTRGKDSTLEQFIYDDPSFNTKILPRYETERHGYINGIEIYQFSKNEGSWHEEHVVFLKNQDSAVDVNYVVEAYSPVFKEKDYIANPYLDQYNQILSTFKFTN